MTVLNALAKAGEASPPPIKFEDVATPYRQ